MTCRWAGRNQPRLLTGHHKPDCDDDACAGCQPCPDDHCPKCWRTHSTGTCTGCVAQGRDDLSAIASLHAGLLAEALLGAAATSGVIPGGEATVALGPCSPGTASRWDAHYADDTRIGDWHPLLTLATWATVWRDWFGTPAPTTRATVAGEAAYLGRILHLAAATQPRDGEWPPELPDMLADLGTLRARLEDVTHDGDRVESVDVPCLSCGGRLRRAYDDPKPCDCPPAPNAHHEHGRCRCKPHDTAHNHPLPGVGCLACRWEVEHSKHAQGGRADGWVCANLACKRRYSDEEFRLARADHLGTAEHFVEPTIAAEAIGRSVATVRDWAQRGVVGVACRLSTRRIVVWWPDVHEQHREREIRDTLRRLRAVS